MKESMKTNGFGRHEGAIQNYKKLCRKFVEKDERTGVYKYFSEILTEILEMEVEFRLKFRDGLLDKEVFILQVPEYLALKTQILRDEFNNRWYYNEGTKEIILVNYRPAIIGHEMGVCNANVQGHVFIQGTDGKAKYSHDIGIEKNDFLKLYTKRMNIKNFLRFKNIMLLTRNENIDNIENEQGDNVPF